jgi:mono/diheme cytochrome c family protein
MTEREMPESLRLVVLAAIWVFAIAGVWPSGGPVHAQAPGAPQAVSADPIWAGVYTPAQAESGETIYSVRCAVCHNPDLSGGQAGARFAPALGGANFTTRWDSNSVDRLFRIIRDSMPRDSPGILGDDGTLDVVAYILKFNGFPSGSTALTADVAALERIAIVPKAGSGKRELANFAPVQVVGCLTRAGTSWMLTSATALVAASDATAATTAGAAPLGDQTYRLVSPAAFRLDSRNGQTVQVKGLLRKDSDETMLNLTSVETIAASCAK